MYKITKKEVIKILKSRLRTQRRVFTFDDNQILVLPVLEHPNGIDESINKIKFFIDSKGGFLTIKDIEGIKEYKDGLIHVYDNKQNTIPLFNKKMDGTFVKIEKLNFSFKNLTIDHSPSIHLVLFSMYINKTSEFKFLKEYCKSITNQKLSLKEIKAAKFKDLTIQQLNSNPNKNKITSSYKSLFDGIELEIVLEENNNANLSLSSLEYYVKNRK